MNILITGATGFVGGGLLRRLANDARHRVRVLARRRQLQLAPSIAVFAVDALDSSLSAADALSGCDAVVHLAARVHVMRETAPDALAEFRRVNVEGTLALARQAVAAGVRRFVFMSSIKVNGEDTLVGLPFRADDRPQPLDAYATSKWEAELGLQEIARSSDMEVVIIRPPLIYGPGVGGNFLQMMHWLYKGVPLPLGAVTGNRRSLIGLDNLTDLIVTCLEHRCAANQVLLARDADDLCTKDLLLRMAAALGRPARLLDVPPALVRLLGLLSGRRQQVSRLLGSLQIDATRTRELLGWVPPVPMALTMRMTAEHFLGAIAK